MNSPQGQVVSGLELWQWRQQAKEMAIAATIPAAEVDWILQEIADLDRLALRLDSFKNWPQIALRLPFADIKQLWQRRIHDRLPVQYITGTTPWRHFSLVVSPAVLIPRPETEMLIDLTVEAFKREGAGEQGSRGAGETGKTTNPVTCHQSPVSNSQFYLADLGTGSGAIALGLAAAFPHAIVHAVDPSTEALAIAQENARGLGLTDQIHFYQGSWFEPLEALKGQLRGMISNPPYIPSQMLPTLQPEVVGHEPHLALDGGSDGLDCIRHLVETAPEYLQSGGLWLIEMMAGQAEIVGELLRQQGSYNEIQIFSDLAGIERFALAYRC